MKTALLELSRVEIGSLALNEALHQRYFKEYPTSRRAWSTYQRAHYLQRLARLAILSLLILTIFETPLWCRGADYMTWDYRTSTEKCTIPGGPPASDIIMSGAPFLPHGIGAMVELVLYSVVLGQTLVSFSLHKHFMERGVAYQSTGGVYFQWTMLILGFADAFFIMWKPNSNIRIAPFVRFGLAVQIPWVKKVIMSFARVTKSIFTIGCFLVGTIVIFAWLAAMIFDDRDALDAYGDPVNQGFESFSNALYTMFVTVTTANLPDVMIPSFEHDKYYLLFWMPFFLLAVCILMQVVLAVVYNEYQTQITDELKQGRRARIRGIHLAFQHVKMDQPVEKESKAQDVVDFNTFVQVVNNIRTFSSSITIDDGLLRVVFDALDVDGSGLLTNSEFRAMCEVLQTHYRITRRDAWVRQKLEGTVAGNILHRLMDNGSEGPDLGLASPPWATPKFNGSPFDNFMNFVLGLNVMWLLVQSVYDLNNFHSPEWFGNIDLLFSFFYIIEVAVKLCWWSIPEYWWSNDNRFDFITTWVLASGGIAVLFFDVNGEVIRYLNLLRLVRLLKALNNVPAYEKAAMIVSRMVSTCGDVLAMNLLLIYLWSAMGQLVFGGQLYETNPALKGGTFDYFDSHFQVYNFNDMIMGAVTMFFVTITGWVDQVAVVCLALHPTYTMSWFLAMGFWLSFYVSSVLIAFNVWTAFSIDVFCTLDDMIKDQSSNKTTMDESIDRIRTDMAEKLGLCLHVMASAELSKERVFANLFEDDDEEEEGEETLAVSDAARHG